MDRILRHGTTRKRAEAILKDGPNPFFVEPGGLPEKERAFSMAPAEGPFPVGSPQEYAQAKAKLFPDEGGPAIVEVNVPDEIAALGTDTGGEIRFNLVSRGLKVLIAAWPTLPKRILP